uniref:Putative C1q domain containing protein MgC1q41 n=1 Tax=Mytilus galloprovincialis TaxID=29158 RepID=F0V478_MYTGA|nr:putative C1q domain containing protein MgC1q41 [Mytilus galloprovincialis]
MILLIVLAGVFGLAMSQGGDIPAVAFSAGLTRPLNLTHSETVTFDRIFTNIGSGYDSNSGRFRCPQSGIYVFQFHALSKQDKTVWLQLYHNYHYVVSVYGHTANDYSAGGNSVAIHISKGDEVYVMAVDSKNGAKTYMYGATDEVYCTFSGYLISPVFEEYPVVG